MTKTRGKKKITRCKKKITRCKEAPSKRKARRRCWTCSSKKKMSKSHAVNTIWTSAVSVGYRKQLKIKVLCSVNTLTAAITSFCKIMYQISKYKPHKHVRGRSNIISRLLIDRKSRSSLKLVLK